MPYEIDYLAVGDGEKSADAICLRYGNLNGRRDEQTVITIDGGTLESGALLAEHIKKHYGTDVVNYAILTHADIDHASGMRAILEDLKVQHVLMNLPWNHSQDVKALLDDSDITAGSVKAKMKNNLSAALEIEQIAEKKGIKITEPFAGTHTQDNSLIFLGPTESFYQKMLAGFKFMPGDQNYGSMFNAAMQKAFEAVASLIPESWHIEKLIEPAADATSPENNSSLIFMVKVDDKKLIFTGDAGVPALTAACDNAVANGISTSGITFFHVPHHGGRRNLSPSILNRLFGLARPSDNPDWEAVVSASKKGAPKHPHKKVTNALKRRGAKVYLTAGTGIRFHHGAGQRQGWTAVEPLAFHNQVEDDD